MFKKWNTMSSVVISWNILHNIPMSPSDFKNKKYQCLFITNVTYNEKISKLENRRKKAKKTHT